MHVCHEFNQATVLIIGYVWPEPNSSAAGSRMMQLIHFFKRSSQRVIFASPSSLGEHREDLNQYEIEEKNIELNSASFDRWIDKLQPDIVMFDRFMMEEQFGWRVEQQCPKALRILNTEDLHSLRAEREKRLKKHLIDKGEFDYQFNHFDTLYSSMVETDLCQREMASIYRCDLTLMISEVETKLLKHQFCVPDELLFDLPFMLEPIAEKKPRFEQREHFITIGNFRHAPNWDSVLWLKTAIWPKIRKKLPRAEMHIYGAYPAKKVTNLHNPKEGFLIKGWAEDAVSVMQNAKICLSPLRFGAGIKGKFTDAMICATPSITTEVGAEGMLPKETNWPGSIANSADEIAEKAVHLYQSEADWQMASLSCEQIIIQRYNATHLEQRLYKKMATLLTDFEQVRKRNFTGLLLRHHHQKSTKYMSQWIEEKNRNNL